MYCRPDPHPLHQRRPLCDWFARCTQCEASLKGLVNSQGCSRNNRTNSVLMASTLSPTTDPSAKTAPPQGRTSAHRPSAARPTAPRCGSPTRRSSRRSADCQPPSRQTHPLSAQASTPLSGCWSLPSRPAGSSACIPPDRSQPADTSRCRSRSIPTATLPTAFRYQRVPRVEIHHLQTPAHTAHPTT